MLSCHLLLNTNTKAVEVSFLKWQIALLSTWHFNEDIPTLEDIFLIAKESLSPFRNVIVKRRIDRVLEGENPMNA